MSTDYKPVNGDRVRLIVEGVAEDSDADGFRVGPLFPVLYGEDKDVIVSIEKVEPPVVTFGPGDVVRHRRSGESYSIGSAGYLSHQTCEFYKWSPVGLTPEAHFNSRDYEKVSLG